MDDNKLLQKLSQNLLEVLSDDDYCDITIEVGDDPYVKIFRAHMVILNYRSTYLRRILSTNKKKNDGTLIQIKLPNILPEIFQIILNYIYGGRLSLEEYDTSDIIKILVSASELSLQELVDYIQSFLTKNKAVWMEQNFNLIYQTSFGKDSFLELQKYCTDLMSNNPNKIFKSLDFSATPENLLVSLIQSDNLQMNEVQVWDNVLKWGFAQNPGFPSDPSNFSKDDFNSLKNTLQQCVPFVRFYNLTSKEFFYNVVPYKKILPKKLYMDLLKTFLDPDSIPNDKPKPRKGANDNLLNQISITTSHYQISKNSFDYDLQKGEVSCAKAYKNPEVDVSYAKYKNPKGEVSCAKAYKDPEVDVSCAKKSDNPKGEVSCAKKSDNPNDYEKGYIKEDDYQNDYEKGYIKYKNPGRKR
ncbi:BTB/POZ protein [Rhizophagus clarus]|uniref:BTB/POZ protein n=1 Tax=Rhizophagus clarus TaxID=94130 RepID=A0A8H3KQ72_9GLOM|nr:BTB/POZ protein [Rhizophagus clarus]